MFNILVGRDFQKQEGLAPQVILLLPILEGLDGAKKMSKSLGNYVGVNDRPIDMFGKLMSISDELMARYYTLLLGRKLPPQMHPLEAKKQLAAEIVETYHSPSATRKVIDEWNARSERRLSDIELPEPPPEFWPFVEIYGNDAITVVLGAFSFCFGIQKSRSDVRRLIAQGSVRLDGKKITDPQASVSLESGQVLRLDKIHLVRIA